MSKFKIFGEDILVSWRNQLTDTYEVDGPEYAKTFLDTIIASIDEHPEAYPSELLPAIMRLRIVKKIQKEVSNDTGRKDTSGTNSE